LGPRKGEIVWSVSAEDWIDSAPVIGSDGTVYFQSLDHYLYAVSSAGIVQWRFDMGGASEAFITLGADGLVYACPAKGGHFYALNAGGGKVWEFASAGAAQFGAPVFSYDGESIYFSASDSAVKANSLFALRKDGTLKWKFSPSQKDLATHAIGISPDGKTLYCPGFGAGEAAIYAIDTSGNLVWRYLVTTTNATSRGTSSPCIDNAGNIYFGGGSAFYSLSPSGDLRWKTDNVNWLSPAAPVIGSDGTIYVLGFRLWALTVDGALKWSSSLPFSNSTPAIDKEGIIFVTSCRSSADTNNVYAFKPDGSIMFRMVLRNDAGQRVDVTSAPAISEDGYLYVGSDDPQGKRLFKIR
jgi:outer membrane protein assembly factor BamB